MMVILAIEDQEERFETYSTSLLKWIRAKTVEMRGRDFSNTLEGIQADFKQFKDYRLVQISKHTLDFTFTNPFLYQDCRKASKAKREG